jgi:hypothetical protein
MSLTNNLATWEHIETTDNWFTEFEKSRIDWRVSPIDKVLSPNIAPYQISEIDECFQRMVAVALELELPVGAFIRSLLEREADVPIEAKSGLYKNILDEEKHQDAFIKIKQTYTPNQLQETIASRFRKQIISSKSHPLVKARDLETNLFVPFQICMRFFGSQSLERIINWISIDENRHIQYNWEVSAALNIGLDTDFNQICGEVAEWVFDPLESFTQDKVFWLDTVYDQMEDGYSERLANLVNYGTPKAPFELRNSTY